MSYQVQGVPATDGEYEAVEFERIQSFTLTDASRVHPDFACRASSDLFSSANFCQRRSANLNVTEKNGAGLGQ